jgi:predicted phage terminase large subunit-like protein
MKKDLGSYGYAGQMQQTPSPTTGAIWEADWFNTIDPDKIPYPLNKFATDWDLAYTKDDRNSASAFVESGSKDGNIYITDLGYRWLEFPDLISWMKSKTAPHYIEGKASGKSAKQTLTRNEINAIEVPKSTDKPASTRMATPTAESGRVYVSSKILHTLLHDERQGIIRFPAGEHDDLNDAFVQALTRHSAKKSFFIV